MMQDGAYTAVTIEIQMFKSNPHASFVQIRRYPSFKVLKAASLPSRSVEDTGVFEELKK
jgi:hypothetical protein